MILGKRKDDGQWQELKPQREFDFHSQEMVRPEGAWATILVQNPDGVITEYKSETTTQWVQVSP